MRVAIISDYLPGYHKIWSGAELIAVTLSDMLRSKGYEVIFLTTPFDYSVLNDNDKIYPVNTPLKRLGALSRNFPIDIGAIRNIYKVLHEGKPDIVHINAKYLFLPTLIVCLRLKIPAVFTVPDYFIFCPTTFIRKPDGSNCVSYHRGNCYECLTILSESPLKKIARYVPPFFIKSLLALRAKEFDYFLKKVSAFVVLSNISKSRLLNYGIPADKVKLIYHYKLAVPEETKENITNPSAIFVGWLSKENGTDILIKAFGSVAKKIRQARLYLVGTGTDSFVNKIKKEIEELDIGDNVIFFGKKNNPEALSIISKCDLVVVPHQWAKEFGPIILIEALALGKPVVTSRIGATDEFVRDGENGFLVEDFKDPEEFAAKMQYLLINPAIAEKMGKKGKASVSFLWDESIKDNLLNLYEEIKNNES